MRGRTRTLVDPGSRRRTVVRLAAVVMVVVLLRASVRYPLAILLLTVPLLLLTAPARPFRWRTGDTVLEWALHRGWTFTRLDRSSAPRWSGPPCGPELDDEARDVVTGAVGSLPVGSRSLLLRRRHVARRRNAFVTQRSRGDRRGASTTSLHVVHLIDVTLPAPLPDLSLRPHGDDTSRDRLAQDVVTESPAFNAEWRVQGGDLRTVHGILHPGTLERLMAEDVRGAHIRTEGSSLRVWWPGATDVDLLDERVAAAVDLAGRIPRHVWQDHGYDPMTARPPEE